MNSDKNILRSIGKYEQWTIAGKVILVQLSDAAALSVDRKLFGAEIISGTVVTRKGDIKTVKGNVKQKQIVSESVVTRVPLILVTDIFYDTSWFVKG